MLYKFSLIKPAAVYILCFLILLSIQGCVHGHKTTDSEEIINARMDEERAKKSIRSSPPEKNHIVLAKELMSRRFYDVALVQLMTASKDLKNRSAELFHLTGVCLREKEEYKEAIKNFNMAIDIDEEFSFAYNGIALTYAMTGETEKARKNFSMAISLNPARADFYNNAGYLEMTQKNYEKAIDLFKKSITIDRGFEQAVNNLAISLGMTGDDKTALDLLLENNPPPLAYNNMGVIYRMKGKSEKAAEMFEKAKIYGTVKDSPEPAVNVSEKEDILPAAPVETIIKKKVTGSVPEVNRQLKNAVTEKKGPGIPDIEKWVPVQVDDWEIVDDGDIEGPSSWYISAKTLRQSSNIYGGKDEGDILDKPGTYTVAGSSVWKDYCMELDIKSHDDDSIGILFRYTDAENYYRFSMDRSRNYRRLIKKNKGEISLLAEKKQGYEKNRKYTVKVIVLGNKILILFDGEILFDVIDHDIIKGKVGVYCWGNEGSEFSYPEVRLKPENKTEEKNI